MMLIRRTAAGVVVGALAVLLVGCGGSDPAAGDAINTTPPPTTTSRTSVLPTPTPTATPTTPAADISGLSADKILSKAQAAAKAATSVRVKGSLADGADRFVMDVRLGKTGGQGSVSVNGAGFALIVTDRTAYLKPSKQFWRAQTKSKAEADAVLALVGNRWIKLPLTDKDLEDLLAFASKPKFFDQLFVPEGSVRKTTSRTVDGVAAIGLRASDGTLWVDRATGRPVRLESSGTDALAFSEYNTFTTPKAPPPGQVIDGKALGM
ncbi:MAG TPA: hypothetical protein VG497_29520 [Kribbella sp.]|nr:hypothetical protein [Kribbella sp.]